MFTAVPARAILNRNWDIVVIGTGMGGAVTGWRLAQAGLGVLFLEKGRAHFRNGDVLRGDFAESYSSPSPITERLVRGGRWSESIADHSKKTPNAFIPFLGCGTGGSTALFGRVMDRLFPCDFENDLHPWPISYQELDPYYRHMEYLFRIQGTADPLRAQKDQAHLQVPPGLSKSGKILNDYLQSQGCHPFQLHMASGSGEPCSAGCQGYLCKPSCKPDASTLCLQPALNVYGAELLDECEVLRLEGDRTRVHKIACRRRGQYFTVRGTTVVLAAGALQTPRLLLNSTSKHWPTGLANRSDLVGRNLMRHYIDLYALRIPNSGLHTNHPKEMVFNDFYASQGKSFGTVQSFGRLPPAPIVLEELKKSIRGADRWPLKALFTLRAPLFRKVYKAAFSKRVVMASIMEDAPRHENRILPRGNGKVPFAPGLSFTYAISTADRLKIDRFRNSLLRLFKAFHPRLIKESESNKRLGHACGTCRFGSDPRTSVLNRFNRTHDLENLYVVDTSFFPTSTGQNPSLTVGANAWRVADAILEKGLAQQTPTHSSERQQPLCLDGKG